MRVDNCLLRHAASQSARAASRPVGLPDGKCWRFYRLCSIERQRGNDRWRRQQVRCIRRINRLLPQQKEQRRAAREQFTADVGRPALRLLLLLHWCRGHAKRIVGPHRPNVLDEPILRRQYLSVKHSCNAQLLTAVTKTRASPPRSGVVVTVCDRV